MKFVYSVLAFLTIPTLALAQAVGTTGAPAAGVSTAAPVVTPPTPTPTVDLRHAPKITCAKPNFDFGNVDEGPDITHKFRIVNKGKSTLKIKSVSTSCGCTAAVAGSKYPVPDADKAQGITAVIPPGASDYIVATFHTNGRPGHSTKFINVANNDPAAPSFQLKLDMTVVREVDMSPDRLYLYDVKHGQPHPSSVTVLGKPDKSLNILSAQSSNGVVTVLGVTPYKDPNTKREGAIVQLDLPVTLPIGTITDNVVIKTDDPKKPDVTLQVMGEITGKIKFNPKSLYFAPNQAMPVTVTFTADDPKKFAIRRVESVKHLVRPSIIKTAAPGGGDQYYLAASVVKNIPKESDGKDQIIVYTNDDEMSKIIIDVQASK